MSYIGITPTQTAFVTDQFSGNGATTVFTMSVGPANTAAVIVAVHGVVQDPSTYSVNGNTLTFSSAPPTGTGNISCRYLGIPASGVATTAYRTVTDFTATLGQTTFTVPSYVVGYIDVYRNGVKLGIADYTATSGTTVVLNNACAAGDLIETVGFYVSSVLNAVQQYNGSSYNQVLTSPILNSATIASLVLASTATINTVSSAASTNLSLQTNAGASTAVTITTSSYVGISTTTPAYPLDVAGAVRFQGSKKVSFHAGMPPNYPANINERIVAADINFAPSSGGTDILITNASQPLGHWVCTIMLSGDSNGTGVGLVRGILEFDTMSNSGGTYYYVNPKLRVFNNIAGTYYAYSTPNVALSLSGTNITLTIAGSSSYSTGLCRVEFFGSNYSYSGLSFNLSLPGTTSSTSWLQNAGWEGINSGTTSASNATGYYTSGGESARFDSNGYLLLGYTSSNGSYKLQVNSQIFATSSSIATSDERYKQNIQPLSNALALVNTLNPVSFDWKSHPVHAFDTSTTTVGFIAQEVQQALAGLPYVNSVIKSNSCTIEPEEKDSEGNITKTAVEEEFLGIAETNMIPLLTKAIQELTAQVKELQAKVGI